MFEIVPILFMAFIKATYHNMLFADKCISLRAILGTVDSEIFEQLTILKLAESGEIVVNQLPDRNTQYSGSTRENTGVNFQLCSQKGVAFKTKYVTNYRGTISNNQFTINTVYDG